jgi:hypothetical protein
VAFSTPSFGLDTSCEGSRDSSVGIATDYLLDIGPTFFCSPERLDRGSGAHPAWGDIPSGVKRQGREADYSHPFNAEIKNGGAVPPLPHMFPSHTV